jgi:hypothetical protein
LFTMSTSIRSIAITSEKETSSIQYPDSTWPLVTGVPMPLPISQNHCLADNSCIKQIEYLRNVPKQVIWFNCNRIL